MMNRQEYDATSRPARAASIIGTALVGCCALAGVRPVLATGGCEHATLPRNAASAVSISGRVALIGEFDDDTHGAFAGAAHVFRFDGSSWNPETTLFASDAESGDYFGWAAAASADVVIVGAWSDDSVYFVAGAAYVFRYDGTTWNQEAKLIASDAAQGDEFGRSVAIRGDVAVIGAYGEDDRGTNAGAAYVFRYDGQTWTEEAKLVGSGTSEDDRFSEALSIDGNALVVGSAQHDDVPLDTGIAHVFRFDGDTWYEESRLLAPDAAEGDRFGRTVSMSGDVVVIGADGDDDRGTRAGSAYFYRFDGNTWIREVEVYASDGSPRDNFGWRVAVSGNAAIVGAPSNCEQWCGMGAAYLFRFDGLSWNEERRLFPAVLNAGSRFGYRVAIDETFGLVRRREEVHVFDLSACFCPADLDNNGVVNFGDVLALLAAWGPCSGCLEDIDGDGTVGFSDLLIVLAAHGPCDQW